MLKSNQKRIVKYLLDGIESDKIKVHTIVQLQGKLDRIQDFENTYEHVQTNNERESTYIIRIEYIGNDNYKDDKIKKFLTG